MVKGGVVDAIKKSKPFRAGDLFIYLTVLVIVFTLFLSFVIIPATKKSSGFKVTVDGELYFTFTLKDKSLIIADGKNGFIESEEKQDGIEVTVYSSTDKSSYNVIFFNTQDNTAKVIESNCSASHDCTYTPKIKDKGAIYCAPHALKIAPNNSDGFQEPIVG